MYGKKYLLTLCVVFFLLMPVHADSQTHTLDTTTLHFKLGNDARVKFDSSLIYLGDSNGLWSWIDDNGIRFYNLRMGASDCPTDWYIKLSSNVDATVTTLFENNLFEMTMTGFDSSSTALVYVGSKGQPEMVYGGSAWSYDSGETTCNVTLLTSKVTLSWQTTDETETKGVGYFILTATTLMEGKALNDVLIIISPLDSPLLRQQGKTFNGEAQFQLQYGTYLVEAIYGDRKESMTVSMSEDRAIGFNFERSDSPPATPHFTWEGWLFVPAVLVIVGYFLYKRYVEQ